MLRSGFPVPCDFSHYTVSSVGDVIPKGLTFLSGGAEMKWRDRIVFDPEILVGKPIIKGTRISVELILGWLAN